MKAISLLLCGILVTVTTVTRVNAQERADRASSLAYQPGYGRTPSRFLAPPSGWQHHASTASEGYARGVATMIYAQAVYNRLTAEARLVQAQAASFEMLNRQQAVQTYFAIRETNRQARAAKREREKEERLDAATLARIARQGRPAPLPHDALDHRTGEVSWPELLCSQVFTPCRQQLETLLAERAATGRLDQDDRLELSQLARTMLANLKQLVRDVSPMEYCHAQRFIKSVAFAAQKPIS